LKAVQEECVDPASELLITAPETSDLIARRDSAAASLDFRGRGLLHPRFLPEWR
jgi:hypothetical protein